MQKTILITGASSGIGRALALAYAEKGSILLLTGRDLARLDEIRTECMAKGALVETIALDITDAKAVENRMLVWDEKYCIDIVIPNAGISGGTSLEKINQREQFDDVVRTNIIGVFNTVNPLLPRMMARKKGQVVLISSMAGFRGMPTAPAYSISKVTVKAYGDAIRLGAKQNGVYVSTVFPGFIRTPLTKVNKFEMPFLMEADKAAEIIKRGIEKKKTHIAFPWQMYLISRAISSLPALWGDFIFSFMPSK